MCVGGCANKPSVLANRCAGKVMLRLRQERHQQVGYIHAIVS
jgi:hypothetical protein